MSAINFPNSPTINDTFVNAGVVWRWNGTKWLPDAVSQLVSLTATQTLLNKTLQSPVFSQDIQITGRVRQGGVVLPGTVIDCSLGNYFISTISGNTTYSLTNVPSTGVYSFTLEVNHTSGTITWFAGLQWPEQLSPVLSIGRTHLFTFITDDGGNRWRGIYNSNYST